MWGSGSPPERPPKVSGSQRFEVIQKAAEVQTLEKAKE